MPSPKEVELKFGVPPTSLWRIEETQPLRDAAGESKIEHLTSVYYDTADHQLNKHGLSLRATRNHQQADRQSGKNQFSHASVRGK